MSRLDALPTIESHVDLRKPEFVANRALWEPILQRFEEKSRLASAEATPSTQLRHQSRGQLLAQDRINLLLDPDSPFLELCAYAGFHEESGPPGANLIAGIGSVSGKACLVLSHIPTQSGGAWNQFTVPKQNRVTEIATQNGLPIIALVQSAGVFLPQQFKIFHAGGNMFRDLAQRSQLGQKSCAVVFGSCTAGGAYHPALSDYTIFVKGQAQVFLAGPPLVKMATGEVVDAEVLGGADMHAKLTGLADHIAADEFDAIRRAREWIATLGSPRPRHVSSSDTPLQPRYPVDDLLALINPDIRKALDMKEILLRIVDDSRLSIFKPGYGSNLLTTVASIMGYHVGIISNQMPVISADEATKGAQFIRLCNQSNLPIIFLHNVTGFMVGTKAEHSAIIRKGAQMVSAVSCSTVPHISIILGASYGAGNYAMCGRSFKPRFLFTWPIGRCSVMGPDQLAGVMQSIEASSSKAKGKAAHADEGNSRANTLRDTVERDSECYKTSGALHDDGVIDPRDTRDVLGMCLEIVTEQEVKGTVSFQSLARI